MTDDVFSTIKSSVDRLFLLCSRRCDLQDSIERAELGRDVHIPQGFNWCARPDKPDPSKPVLKINGLTDIGKHLCSAVLPALRKQLAEVDKEIDDTRKHLAGSPKTKNRRKK